MNKPLSKENHSAIQVYLEKHSYGVNLEHVQWLRALVAAESSWREAISRMPHALPGRLCEWNDEDAIPEKCTRETCCWLLAREE